MNVGTRLAAGYAIAIFLALLVFAAIAVFAIDRTLRSSLDTRLAAEARAIAVVLDIRNGSIAIDADDQQQITGVLGADGQAAVIDAQQKVVLSSAAHLPAAIIALPKTKAGYYSGGAGDNEFRAAVLPVKKNLVRAGSIVVWRASDWIDDTDRGAAIAFVSGALVIAVLALLAGGGLTRRALDEAFLRQRRFTADASHELRAPLAVIRAEAELAARKDRSPHEYRTTFETIAFEADHIEAILGDLLTAARLEDSSVVLQDVDVMGVLQSVAQRLSTAASAKGAAIEVARGEPLMVRADAPALQRVLLAVTHNAIKFAPERGHVWLDARDAGGGSAVITIRDDGPGFSKDALAHALDRFWRDDTARPQGGTGLGLAIARSIVDSFGGSIALENTATGAAVRITLISA